MSLEEHHKFILDTMDRQNAIARKFVAELEAENARLKAEVERLTERLGGVRLIVTEEMYDELNTKYLEQHHELQNIALTARQILDEKIDLKAEVERLKSEVDGLSAQLVELDDLKAENARMSKDEAYYEMRHKELIADKLRLGYRVQELTEKLGEDAP